MKHPPFINYIGQPLWNVMYKFGGGGKARAPIVRPPVATPETLSQQAQGAGQEEKKRLKFRRGQRGTIFAGRRDLAPATTGGGALRQTL